MSIVGIGLILLEGRRKTLWISRPRSEKAQAVLIFWINAEIYLQKVHVLNLKSFIILYQSMYKQKSGIIFLIYE